MGTFSRYISEDDDRDEELEFEQDAPFDGARFLRAVRDPASAQIESAPSGWRQDRRSDGLGPMLAMKEEQGAKGQIPTLAASDSGGLTNTAKRIQVAQWGTEDADEDRLTPEQVQSGNKMLSSTDDQPVKPPGPDSPSTGYKEPSRYDKAKAAYDKEFGPGKKHKWYSLESTKDWQARRASMQYDLMLEQRQEEEERRQAQTRQPYVIKTQEVKTQDGKKNVVGLWSDGSTNVMLSGLDDLAEQKYEPGVRVTADGRLNRLLRGSTRLEPVTGDYAGSRANPFLSGLGPLAPDAQVPQYEDPKPRHNPDAFVSMAEGTAGYVLQDDGTYKKVIEPTPKTSAPKSTRGGGGGGGTAPKDPDAVAKKEAKAEAVRLLKGNETYEALEPEVKLIREEELAASILAARAGATPAKARPIVKIN